MPSENGRRQFIIFAFRRHIKRRLCAVCRRFAPSFRCLRRMPVASGKPCAGWLCRLKQYEGMRFRRHPPVAEIPSASCPIIA
ncbi:TPA: hypothetical protein ACJKG7_001480 [Neisseria meningitidis]